MNQTDIYDSPLATLDEDGKIPTSVLGDAVQAHNTVIRMMENDQIRSKKRALVKGLVDGNQPYSSAKQRQAGMGKNTNINWRVAESYLNAALTAFYDIFAEAPTYTSVTIKGDTPQETQHFSRTATEHFDWLQKQDKSFDFNMQVSQYEMVLFGCGPMLFEDDLDWRCRAIACGDLKVLDRTRSDTRYWPIASVMVTYRPDELYQFISNEKAAKSVGWDVEATRKTIMMAHPQYQNGGVYLDWEWHQQQLKNGAFSYSQEAASIFCAHLFAKEFPRSAMKEGRITHRIVIADQSAYQNCGYLFSRIDRYPTWQQCIHPMYYDHGGGGFHHSVTGMGVKMYSVMELQNRFLCHMADQATAPKMMFKPTTANDKQKFSLLHLGEHAVLPAGFDFIQTGVAGYMNDGLAFNREMTGTISSNLSQYRQNLEREQGNPITASESNWRASEQAKLGKTQLNRYYAQCDNLYEEKYRRASNPKLTVVSPGGREALEFQRRCSADGLPIHKLRRYESVKATRVIGQGSIYLRQQSLEFLLGMIGMFPEGGRDALVQDVIAARAGQIFVDRYYPLSIQSQRPTDQHAFATEQVAGMKVGVPPVVTDTQDAIIYAQTFLAAASQATTTLEQGADPMAVFAFLEIAGPSISAHINRLRSDPSRKPVVDVLDKQLSQLAKITDQIRVSIQRKMQDAQAQQSEAAQAQQQAASIQAGVDPKIQIKAAETAAKIRMAQQKTDAALAMKKQKSDQSLALSDATVAAKIRRESQNPEPAS